MRMRMLFALLLGVFGAVVTTVSLPSSASATEKQYYWDGNESIIVKHPYFTNTEECKDARAAGRPCNESAEFVLDRSTRDPFEFYAEDHNDTIKKPGTDSRCTFYQYRIDVTFDQNGVARAAGVRVPKGHGAASVHDAGMAVQNEACQSSFQGDNDDSHQLTNDLHLYIEEQVGDLNKPFTISGAHGRDGQLSALEAQLGRMYEREKKHFVHRVCSTHPEAGTGSVDPASCDPQKAEKAYKIIWDYCNFEARNLNKEDQRTAEIKSCIQSKAGISLNSSLVDNTNYNRLSYVQGESCSIKYIGWIICPVSRFLASVTDAAFDGLSNFLMISPLNRGSQAGDALFKAWSLVSNFANVLFIFAFLAIVFSQITGQGMSNYNIKKMLPRLILIAIFVNISYYLCVVAVDVSNILGRSLIDIIGTLEPSAVNKPSTWSEEVENVLVFTAGATGIGLVILTASSVAMFPLLVGAALSFLVAIIMIVARYALVILLILIAPFAIALALLPNTQKWYSQWQKVFISMLMLFPMISIVFGLSKVAGILVLNSSLSRSTGDITLQLFGLAIMALPLALTPVLMKLGGGVLNRFGGSVTNNGLFKKARDGAQGYSDRKREARDVAGLTHFGDNKRRGLTGARDKMIQRRYRKKALHSLNDQEKNRGYADYISGYTSGKTGGGGDQTSRTERSKEWLAGKVGKDYEAKTKGDKFAESLAKNGGSTAQVKADAIKAQLSINAEEVKASKLKLQNTVGSNIQELRKLATDQKTPETIRQAAIEMVTEQGSVADINAVVKSSGNMTKTQRQTLIKGVSSGRVTGKAAYYSSPGAITAIRNGEIHGDDDFTQHVVSNWINSGEVSADNVGSMHAGGLAEVGKALGSNHIQTGGIETVSAAAKAAKASSSIQSKAHGTQESIATLDAISRLR